MTRLAVLSDIHGNLPALEAVLADLAGFEVDQIIVAGDVVNWGPFSAQVMDRLAALPCAIIRGNNEFYLLDYNTPRAPLSWSDRSQWQMLPWLQRQLAGAYHARVAVWPDTLSLRFPDGPPIRVVHGSPRSPWEGIFSTTTPAELASMVGDIEESIVIAGHTHLAMDRRIGDLRVLNPGSVGVPLDGALEASYLLLEARDGAWQAAFRRVPFSNEQVLREFERRRFVHECGVIGRLVVEEFRTARIQVHPFLHWRAAHYPGTPLRLDHLDAFRPADRWAYTPEPYRVNLDRT